MIRLIGKVFKIAVVGSSFGFGLLARQAHNQNQQEITKLESQKIIKEINQRQRIKQLSVNIKTNQLQLKDTEMAKQESKQEQKPHHQHNSDIRVLDMVGFPAVHGANILENRQNIQKQKEEKLSQAPIPVPVPAPDPLLSPKPVSQPIKIIQEASIQTKIDKKQQIKKDKGASKAKRTVFAKISDIPQFSIDKAVSPDDFIIIVADLPYNQTFQNQVLNKLSNAIKRRSGSQPLQVYRLKITDPKVKAKMSQKYKADIKQQTILLLKNPYEDKFINIDFELYIQQANLPPIYLSQLRIAKSEQQLKRQLNRMTPNDTYLLLAIDTENDPDIAKRKLTAKYIQMQMGVNNIENIKLYVIDQKVAKQAGVISKSAKANSLHLIRKNNQFTYKPANKWIYNTPYNVVENVSLYDKSNYIMIPRYLSKIETFNSLKIDAPYVCSITIDRNRTNPRQQRQILKVFSKLKQSQQFPQVSFVLKFGETQFRGKQEDPFSTKKWVVKVANLDQIDKQLLVHEVRSQDDAKSLGINQKNWLRNTFQYLYKQPQITAEGMRNFIRRSINGEQPQFFKSEAKFKLGNLQKVTSQNFNSKIIQKFSHSHLVFEYSDHCQTCQVISPIIDYFSDVCTKFPDLRINVYALNCDKNKVKGQPYSPYTPNLYYYSRNWQNKTPLRYPIVQFIGQNNIWGIYDFCVITQMLKKVDLDKFNAQIKNFMENKINLTDF